jgi:hypothetical protein
MYNNCGQHVKFSAINLSNLCGEGVKNQAVWVYVQNGISIDFYEKTKGMSPTEINAFIKAQVAPVHQKYGIRTVSKIKSDGRRIL